MPVDNAPATAAQNLLNGIDYSALIGGPLEAAIKAQVMAAQSTWEFIKNVGLNEDKNTGEKSAVNVSFTYQQDGREQKLIVPILVIVPIPAIVVDLVNIDFTANINAASSSTTETTSEQNIAAEAGGKLEVGFAPYASLSANFKASYSSKKASKATSESRYSVEYTQNVAVRASQADLPAGLSTVLNILSAAATTATPGGELSVSPPAARLTGDNNSAQNAVRFNCSIKNGNGLYVTENNGMSGEGEGYSFDLKKHEQLFEVATSTTTGFKLGVGPSAKIVAWQEKGVKPDPKGELLVSLWVDEQAEKGTYPLELEVTGVYTEGEEPQPEKMLAIPLSINIEAREPTIRSQPAEITVVKGQDPKSVTVTVTDATGAPAPSGTAIDFELEGLGADDVEIKVDSEVETSSFELGDNGQQTLKLSAKDAITGTKDAKLKLSWQAAKAEVEIQVKDTEEMLLTAGAPSIEVSAKAQEKAPARKGARKKS
ncbi:MAG: DUF2589 domain-containing protein [bacterium]|nr:DUF2589 domain-containing protein [bacterium]